jgi:hypothetical protein
MINSSTQPPLRILALNGSGVRGLSERRILGPNQDAFALPSIARLLLRPLRPQIKKYAIFSTLESNNLIIRFRKANFFVLLLLLGACQTRCVCAHNLN